MFHVDLLTPYRETEFHGRNYERPPPDLVEGEEEYEVERVLDSRRHGRGKCLQYLVKWKGYPDSENQWVDAHDLHAPDLISEFQTRNSASQTHIRRLGQDDKGPIPSSHLSSEHSSSKPTSMSTSPNNVPAESPMPSLVDIDELPQTPHHSMLDVLISAVEVAIDAGGGEITGIIRVGTPAARRAHIDPDQENIDPLPIPPRPSPSVPPPVTVSSAINTLRGTPSARANHPRHTAYPGKRPVD